jgi:DNA repair protein RadC
LGEEGSKKDKVVHIKNWPEGDRPREMLLAHGPEALSDAALLAILLRTGRQGKDAVALAREMLSELGGFQGLLSASCEDLLNIKGIGQAKIAQILAAMEIVKRQLRQPLKKPNIVQSPSALFEYLKVSMGNLNKEEFRLLHLNRAKALIAEEIVFRGTVDNAFVYPREIVESALRKKASALILAHNHPTGEAEASEEDLQLTRSLVQACWTVDIPILDHIIVGRGGFMSMRRYYPDIFEGENEVA